ncbi:MAG: ComEC/Rec2 family competence protein [Sphingomonadaceae bacterium]
MAGATLSDATSIARAPRPRGLRGLGSAAFARLEAWLEAERGQLPLWIPVARGAGIAAWFSLGGPYRWAGFALAALALAIGAFALGRGTRLGRALAVFALAAALGLGLIWLRAERVAAPVLEYPQAATFVAEVAAVEALPARGNVRLLLDIKRVDGDRDLPPRIRVNLDEEDYREELRPGATVALKAWLMPPAPMAVPGGYDFARRAWFERFGATGRVLGAVVLVEEARGAGWRARIGEWRQRLAAHVRSRIEGGAGAIAATLATGDRGAISEADAEAMRRSGLAHLLSISGLNVAAVVGAAMLLVLKLLALSPALALRLPLVLVAAGAGALAGVAYTLLTGAQVPTVRACVAALLVLAGIALGRDALTLRLVAAGALVVLLLWPESLAGPSFQLSFAAVTAIVALHEHPRIKRLLARREEGRGARLMRGLLSLFLTGLAVEAALMPIALYHFHKAGLYGALANIVAIPLTTFVIMPLEALALLFDLVGLGAPFWWLAGTGLNALLALAHGVSGAPGAVTLMPAMPPAAFGLMVLGGLWLALWRTKVRRLGLLPLAAGAALALATPAPDILVTGDGRHLAIRAEDGGVALLRGGAGDYVRDMLAEASGYEGELSAIPDLPQARCSRDLCLADIVRDGRRWRLLATRSDYFVEIEELVEICSQADIIVSDRRLPRTCVPRWLKADRSLLRRTGGLAIALGERPRVDTVAGRIGGKPWWR